MMKVQRNSIKVSADKVSALHLIVDFRGCRKERRRVEWTEGGRAGQPAAHGK